MSDTKQETIDFAAFIAKVPDAPSSAIEGPSDDADPKAETGSDADSAPTKHKISRSQSVAAKTAKAEPAPSSDESDSTSESETSAEASATPTLDSVRAALKAGDLDLVAELLDEDPAGFDEKTPKWAARQRKEKKLKEESAAVRTQAETIVKRWAPVSALASDVAQGAFDKLPELVEMLTGHDWDSAAMKAFRARTSTDPRVPALTKRAAEAESRLADAEAERTKHADRAFHETIRDEVPVKDVVRKIDGWEEKVARVLRDSVDADLGEPTLSVKQAAARVVRKEREEYEKRAAVFADAPPARAPRGRTPERADGASGTTKRKVTREEWLAAHKNG
jgi:hypothetical protein